MENINDLNLAQPAWLESRVALYLEAVNIDRETALKNAGKAVAEARVSLGDQASDEKILNLALKIIQAYVVCPLARARPMSFSHMLPEGFVVKPIKSGPAANSA